ncbi:hypothetical protein EZJ58_1946 [Sodalis ligni]|uniref:Uncharacterized protein n=1 Tax=Sodalis ligni TaxID=2697027 RepID=A0A4R1NGM0_9GAMM|nr:hypothetical protein EZJ58_1946 [Sodalis ligni]
MPKNNNIVLTILIKLMKTIFLDKENVIPAFHLMIES